MKKLLLSLCALATVGVANAQLAAGSKAPNWTMKDLNGNTYTLYDYLDQGKTVFIDVSAAWCGPCWSYHNSGALEDLFVQHGPTGMPGVSASTTNDVMVFMIEGESTNSKAQLYGPAASTGSYATTTQGDWVTGTPYPIIDTNAATTSAFNTAWNIGYFPTIYMVCRDRLVYEVGQLTTPQLYAAVAAGCPSYAPSSTVDAKAVLYSGSNYFVCNATPTVKFQNYSTNTLTSATIEILNGANVVATQAWTGSLAPYDVASVTISSFSAPASQPYKFRVTASGDTQPTNNVSTDSLFRVFTASSANAIPHTENFDATYDFPATFGGPYDGTVFVSSGTSSTPIVQANGQAGKALTFDFYSMTAGTTTEVFAGIYNTTGATHVSLDFDLAYAQYTASAPEDDKIEVLLSTNCGSTWTPVWSKSGDAMKTHAPVGPNIVFYPTAAGDWKHQGANLDAYANQTMLLKIKGTSDYGNRAWIDNFKVSNTVGVNDVVLANSLKVFPNPAKDIAHLVFNLKSATDVQISVMDATGRVVNQLAKGMMNAGDQKLDINTANLAAGVYNVIIRTENGSQTERLTVAK